MVLLRVTPLPSRRLSSEVWVRHSWPRAVDVEGTLVGTGVEAPLLAVRAAVLGIAGVE